MVPQPGTRDNGYPPAEPADHGGLGRILSSTMQFVMFCLLAGAAVGLFGAVLLLPEYAKCRQTQYQQARKELASARLDGYIAGYEQINAELPHDAVLIKRLTMNELGYWPKDEVVVLSNKGPCAHSPATVVVPTTPEPTPPAGWVMTVAQRVADPPTKRGLILLSVVGLVAAVLLFPGGAKQRQSS